MVAMPQYLLYCDSSLSTRSSYDSFPASGVVGEGSWRFVLERLDEQERFEAEDFEANIHRDRLALLAVVRGLEALEHGGLVRLITTSRYVDRGMRFGLPNWRDSEYQWESFGRLTPIRNADLWRRIDTAMQFHEITSRLIHPSSAARFNSRLRLDSRAYRGNRAYRGPAYRGHSMQPAPIRDTAQWPQRGHSTTQWGHSTAERPPSSFWGAKAYWGHSTNDKNNPLEGSDSQADNESHRLQWWEMAATWIQNSGISREVRGNLATA